MRLQETISRRVGQIAQADLAERHRKTVEWEHTLNKTVTILNECRSKNIVTLRNRLHRRTESFAVNLTCDAEDHRLIISGSVR